MSSSQSLPNPPDDTDFYRRHLHDLIELGSAVARMVHDTAAAAAKAQPDEPQAAAEAARTVADSANAFDRVARAVRRTVLLARSLSQPPPQARDHGPARKRILRTMQDIIGHAHAGPAAAAMEAELLERIDAPDLLEELEAGRSIADIVHDLCSDLGVHAAEFPSSHRRRTPADIELLRAQAAGPADLGLALPPTAAQAGQAPPPPPDRNGIGSETAALVHMLAGKGRSPPA